MAAAGAAGNLTDRLVRGPSVGAGSIVDWVQVTWYRPYFNLADVLLRGAVIVGLVLSMRRDPAR
jgi:signal peptidase II